jgi:hypothetical protein
MSSKLLAAEVKKAILETQAAIFRADRVLYPFPYYFGLYATYLFPRSSISLDSCRLVQVKARAFIGPSIVRWSLPSSALSKPANILSQAHLHLHNVESIVVILCKKVLTRLLLTLVRALSQLRSCKPLSFLRLLSFGGTLRWRPL